jgi:hypothetical protein
VGNVGEARDIERLVCAVTDLVVARLDGGGPAQVSHRTDEVPGHASRGARGNVLAVLPVPPGRPADLARDLEELVRLGWRIRGTGSPEALAAMQQAGLPDGVAWKPLETAHGAGGADARPGSHDVVVLGSLGFAFARRLADLDDDDPVVRLIARALLGGRKVLALADDLAPTGTTASGAVAREAAERLQGLARLGVDVRRAAELEGVLSRLADAGATVARTAGGLLTEADVVRLREAGETRLVLPPRTIVTPLARSKAVELGLSLEEGG